MLYKYIKKHFNILFFITITLISMIISLNFQDLRAVFISLEMIYLIVYFVLGQLTEKVHMSEILCVNGITLGVLIVYFLRLMNSPDRDLKLLNKLDALKIASIPYIILFIIILFIVKPLYAKTKNKTVFKITFSIFLMVFLFCTLRFYFYMI
ncbi:hypothetical protein DP144_12245 [Clostridium tetani]|nr:hypothetical protein DP133_04050 [Clostridium tetani]RXM74716.1 hypothetical protein DP154_12235 [Clostridium tetani]RYU98138.1 hypothetical protein DP144_12245 [Clostridium tetani]